MIHRSQAKELQRRAVDLFGRAAIQLTDEEQTRIEVADFGLGSPECEGAQIFTFVQTNRYAAKVIALLPGQTLPEHWHPRFGDDPGKLETVRVAWGTLFLVGEGPGALVRGTIPAGKEAVYTLRHEEVLGPAGSRTFRPGEKHWFQAGPEGVVVYSFSSVARDALDGFTDPTIERVTRIVED
jgi:D-lyxose ketol-isomerase